MAKVYDSILDLVGKTPLVELKRIEEKEGLQAKLIAKVESFNPAGSVKDRIAKAMIEDAEAKGLLKEGSVIIEPTSGNTGIGLAAAATVKGYRMILTMPETMSVERRNIVKAYGAEVVLTDGTKGMKGAIKPMDQTIRFPDLGKVFFGLLGKVFVIHYKTILSTRWFARFHASGCFPFSFVDFFFTDFSFEVFLPNQVPVPGVFFTQTDAARLIHHQRKS